MSYHQSYNASVPYSGTVSVSYPKSESGGSATAHYSGEVPVYVTINVNTAPFDGSVHKCNNSIDLLTGSVLAMNAAQVAAIKESALDVSRSLINGFFGTINTELSQQIQEQDSAIKAGLGLLLEQGKAVDAQRQTLETDYNRVKQRYTALFINLDEECYKRIYALDKAAFSLCEKVKQPLLNAQTHNAAQGLLEIEEESSVKSFLLVSNLNTKARQVLQTLFEYITQEELLTAVVSSFLNNEQLAETERFYTPLIFTESDLIENNGTEHEYFIQQQITGAARNSILETAERFCNDAEYEEMNADEYERVIKEVDALSESYFAAHETETDRRVYQAMLALRGQNKIATIKK